MRVWGWGVKVFSPPSSVSGFSYFKKSGISTLSESIDWLCLCARKLNCLSCESFVHCAVVIMVCKVELVMSQLLVFNPM